MDIDPNRASEPGATAIADLEETGAVSPLRAIRRYCLWCSGTSHEVELCVSKRCPLWLLRFGHRPTAEAIAEIAHVETHPRERLATQAEVGTSSRLKAIRRKCLDCSGASPAAVTACTFGSEHGTPCALWAYRLGKNPNRTMSEEQKAAAAARLSAYRADATSR